MKSASGKFKKYLNCKSGCDCRAIAMLLQIHFKGSVRNITLKCAAMEPLKGMGGCSLALTVS